MYYLIYTSYAVNQFDEDALKALLLQSRADNNDAAITGMLYYYNGSFIQLIEGEEQAVKHLYQNILKDPRHHFIVLLNEGYITTRHFPDWTMGFKSIEAAELKNYPIGAEHIDKHGIINPSAVLHLFNISAKKDV